MGKMNLDISGMLSGGTGMLGAIANNLKPKDTSDIEDNLQDAASTQFSTGNFDNIQDQYYSTLNGIGRYGEDRFVRGIDEIAGNTLNATMSGAELGTSIYPGWGTLIGAGVGLLGGVGTGIAGRIKGRGTYEDYLSEVTSIKNLLAQNRNTAIMDTKDKNFNTMALHLGAFGGNLPIVKDIDVTNGVTTIENGGTHEENPNGGVQYGVDNEGNPNYVEEDEVIYNNFAFSNRLKPTKELLKRVGLPESYSKYTFAEIAEKESKESKNRPLDHISRNGLEASLSKYAVLQELLKQQMQENEEFEAMENDIEEYANGGKINIKASKKGTFTAAARKRGMGVQEFARKVLANKDKYSPAMVKKANFARNAAKWKAFGGNIYADGTPNLMTLPKREDWDIYTFYPDMDIERQIASDIDTQANKDLEAFQSDEEKIFNKNLYEALGLRELMDSALKDNAIRKGKRRIKTNPVSLEKSPLFNSDGNLVSPKYTYSLTKPKDITFDIYKAPAKTAEFDQEVEEPEVQALIAQERAERNAPKDTTIIPDDNIARYAPIFGSTMQYLGDIFGITNYEDYSDADIIGNAARNIRDVSTTPIGGYMRYQPTDINYDTNMVDAINAGVRRSLLDLVGGNAGAAMASTLQSNAQAVGQRGDIRRRAREYNDSALNRVMQFNTGIDQFNAQQALQAAVQNQGADVNRGRFKVQEANLRDMVKTATSQAKSANATKFYDNIGESGRDKWNENAALAWLKGKGLLEEYLKYTGRRS